MPSKRCQGILIVEDEAPIRECLKHMFELEGHQVAEAADGSAALEYLATNQPPCFVLLDLMMPKLTGWQFLQIRANSPALLAIPVVIMSATEPEAHSLSLADDFVRKPFGLDQLLKIVKDRCAPHT